MSQELFTLGELHVADFLKPEESPKYPPHELKLMMNDDGVVVLNSQPPAESMWQKNYWYRSSINASMRKQLKDVVDSIVSVYKAPKDSLWCDIASNDGYLLSCVPKDFIKIGIDPAPDSYKLEAEKYADIIIQDYFSAYTYKKVVPKRADVITCISMLYDVQDIDKFLQGVVEVLNDEGLFVAQLSYTPAMLQNMLYDNICHEHHAYYSLFNLKKIFERNGLFVLDCELNETNGGSFRVYAMKQGSNPSLFGSQSHRDICQYRIKSILEYEKTLALDEPTTWKTFFYKIGELKKQTIEFLQKVTAEGKIVAGYAASTKAATTTQFFGLNEYVDYIADRSAYKHGLKTVDGIPIVSEDEFRKRNPDYLIIFAPHFLDEFKEREKEYLEKGGTMIVMSPLFEVIKNNYTTVIL